jgi:hypothetical protein
MLATNEAKSGRERLTLIRLFEELRGLGYAGGYDAVRRYARTRRRARGAATSEAYVPLSFAPGEAYQFDWSHEIVVLNGVTTVVKVAHVRLCLGRMPFVRAYPRESQEMVFDAHDRAFAFYRGACARDIYDNMKTAVESVFVGKDRAFNRRFMRMCSHYLVEGYYIHARDGDIGHVEDFLISTPDWAIRYLVVDTKNWWPGKHVLVAPQWASGISWSERAVTLEMTRDQIETAPEYDPAQPVDRAFEQRLFEHYGRPDL